MATAVFITICAIALLLMTISITGIAADRERKKYDQYFIDVDRSISKKYFACHGNELRNNQDRR